MRKLIALLCVAGAAWSQTAAVPDELLNLAPLLANEQEALDAARKFHRQQEILLRWDLDMAHELRMKGDNELAEEKQRRALERAALVRDAYRMFLNRYPKNARGLNYLGEVLYDYFNAKPRAVILWHEAIDNNPKYSPPYNNLAIHYGHHGDYVNALDHYNKALKLDPKHPDYLFNLAQFYLIHFDVLHERYDLSPAKVFDGAMDLSRKAVKYAPEDYQLRRDYALNFFAGERFDVEVNWKDAADAWGQTRLLADNRMQRFEAWLYEARAWLRHPDPGRARACLLEAQQLEPNSDVVQRLLEKTAAMGQ